MMDRLVHPAAIAQLLAWAEQSLAPRRELPVRLRRFPFALPFLTRALRRLDALASRESRHAGLLLHAALHAVVTSNAHALARLKALERPASAPFIRPQHRRHRGVMCRG